MESLKSIIARRRTVIPHEPFASIVFTIYTIDATALISCSVGGTAVLDHTFREHMPTSRDLMHATPLLATDLVTSLDREILEPAYSLLHNLVILWTILGQTSCQIKQEIRERCQIQQAQDHSGMINPYPTMVTRWHAQISHTRDALKQLWQLAPEMLLVPPSAVTEQQQPLFERARQIHGQVSFTLLLPNVYTKNAPFSYLQFPFLFCLLTIGPKNLHTQAILLYNSSLIYSHTTMWPAQAEDLDRRGNDFVEVQQSVTDILKATSDIVARGDTQQRSAVLALLLAGNASRNENERYSALELLKRFEETSLGCNTRATRILFEAVLKKKDELRASGFSEHVDWIGMAQELGWQHLVNFGL